MFTKSGRGYLLGDKPQFFQMAEHVMKKLLFVLLVALVVRVAFIYELPDTARSVDSWNWGQVADLLASGHNPYQREGTALMAYPPFWMQTVYCMAHVATALHVPLLRVMQAVLVGTDLLMLLCLIGILREAAPDRPWVWAALFGVALNPALILVSCQHNQIDPIMAVGILGSIYFLCRLHREKQMEDWLMACLMLGIAALVKQIALVLVPLLAGGFRMASNRQRVLGTALVLGPITLGMSIIYVLSPAEVTAGVLKYHAVPGYFGISGLLHLMGREEWVGVCNVLFFVALIASAVTLTRWTWFQLESSTELVLAAGLLLLAIPTIGSGWATQYCPWYVALLAATYPSHGRLWKSALATLWVALSVTYIIDYSLNFSLGCGLPRWLAEHDHLAEAQNWLPLAQKMSEQNSQMCLRLPLFAVSLGVLMIGLFQLFHSPKKAIQNGQNENGRSASSPQDRLPSGRRTKPAQRNR